MPFTAIFRINTTILLPICRLSLHYFNVMNMFELIATFDMGNN